MEMNDEPEWTEIDFRILLENPQFTDQDLAQLFHAKSTEHINNIRNEIHSYHQMMYSPLLTEMMIEIIDKEPGRYLCPKCDKKL